MTNETLNKKIDEMKVNYGIEFNDFGFDVNASNDENMAIAVERENEILSMIPEVKTQTLEIPKPCTSRVMDAVAKSIGCVFEDARHPELKRSANGDRIWGKKIGNNWNLTTKGLAKMIWDTVEKSGDREVLKDAKYSSGIKCFSELN